MAKSSTVINGVSKDLAKYKEDMIKKIKELVGFVISDLLLKAQRDLDKASYDRENMARANIDSANRINLYASMSVGGLKGEVGVQGFSEDDPIVQIAAYIEFGTGLSAKEILSTYPQEIKEIARRYFKTGDGTIKGNPYLYNNYLALLPQFEKDLKAIIRKRIVS